ncbi:hypothetical protein NKH77_31105 [Streptomyces sp. M19]
MSRSPSASRSSTPGRRRKAKAQAGPNIASLPGDGVPVFCRQTQCQSSSNAIGRYAYFTISGYTSGKAVTSDDATALQAGRDLADHAFRRIVARGNARPRPRHRLRAADRDRAAAGHPARRPPSPPSLVSPPARAAPSRAPRTCSGRRR